jgi:hypothetical protein
MNRIILAATITTSCLLSACASPIAGTWQGRAATGERPFSFGSVTFAGDGTYTAEAKYGDSTRAVSGTWVLTGDTIMMYGEPFGERTYTVEDTPKTLVFTDPESGRSMTLDRFN